MGWTTYPKPADPKADLDRQLTWENDSGKRTVLKSALTLTNYFAAVEHIKPDGTRTVWAATFLIRNNPKAADGYTFGYKDMDESMGPYRCDGCPKAILDLLTEPLNENAREWRARQRNLLVKRAVARQVKNGTTIKLDHPVSFGAYGKHDVFTKVAYGKRTNVFRTEAGGYVRLTNWRTLDFTIVE